MLNPIQTKRVQEAERNIQRSNQIQAYGDFLLDLVDWDWFATVTLTRARSPFRAMADVRRFFEELERAACRPIGWAVAESRAQSGANLHFHLLVAGVDALN